MYFINVHNLKLLYVLLISYLDHGHIDTRNYMQQFYNLSKF